VASDTAFFESALVSSPYYPVPALGGTGHYVVVCVRLRIGRAKLIPGMTVRGRLDLTECAAFLRDYNAEIERSLANDERLLSWISQSEGAPAEGFRCHRDID
jgi:hypothetical protein